MFMGLHQITHMDGVPKCLFGQEDVTKEMCSPWGHRHLRSVLFSTVKETSCRRTSCSTDVPPGVLKVKLILPSQCQRGLTPSSWNTENERKHPNQSQHHLLTTVQHQSSAVLSQCPSTCPWNLFQREIKDFIGIRYQRTSIKPNSACYCYSHASTFSVGWEADFIVLW